MSTPQLPHPLVRITLRRVFCNFSHDFFYGTKLHLANHLIAAFPSFFQSFLPSALVVPASPKQTASLKSLSLGLLLENLEWTVQEAWFYKGKQNPFPYRTMTRTLNTSSVTRVDPRLEELPWIFCCEIDLCTFLEISEEEVGSTKVTVRKKWWMTQCSV